MCPHGKSIHRPRKITTRHEKWPPPPRSNPIWHPPVCTWSRIHSRKTPPRPIHQTPDRQTTEDRMAPHHQRSHFQKHRTTPRKHVQTQQRKWPSLHWQEMGNPTHNHHLEDSTKIVENTVRTCTWTRHSNKEKPRSTYTTETSTSMLRFFPTGPSQRPTHVRRDSNRNNG